MTAPIEQGCPPNWAGEWGEDEFGVFVGFSMGASTYRFRWIRAGRFTMGSPESEAGRFEDEGTAARGRDLPRILVG